VYASIVAGSQAVLGRLASRRRQLVVFAVAVGAFGGVLAQYHGAQGGQAGCDDGDSAFNHGDSAGEHSLVFLGVIGSDNWRLALAFVMCRESKRNLLLAITTKKPREKTAATPSFCLSFIWSRETMVMGRQMIITSVKMLTCQTLLVCEDND
jgi:hypothetical protein